MIIFLRNGNLTIYREWREITVTYTGNRQEIHGIRGTLVTLKNARKMRNYCYIDNEH